jgi:AGCS family alanine or glycine:cation symporter
VLILDSIVGLLWGPWTPWFLFAAGVIFTVWTRFTQYRSLTHGVAVVRGIYDRPEDPGAINHFQALSAALSGTVGLGNIGGVALAIGLGGPGALFWMWIIAIFGMALKSVEITLAMLYRNTDDPENPHGGAMWVVDKVFANKGSAWRSFARAVGVFFCLTLINSALTGSSMFQAWNVAVLSESYFNLPRIGSGILMAVLVGLVIIGGIKRIGQVAGKLVPFMCALYILSAFAVLAVNVADIPGILALVVKSAFQSTEAAGAFIGGTMGFAFMQGMKRALYSNEAGQGSAPIAHAAAKTDEPAREGIVGGLGPFIDTICICTLTALVILSTDTWNRDPIGDFQAPITLVPVTGESAPTWKVRASASPTNLPQSRFEAWSPGTNFFLLAQVRGATGVDNGQDRITVAGTIEEVASEASTEAPGTLTIEWRDVVLSPRDWMGDPQDVVLLGQGVYRSYDGAPMTAHAFDRAFPGLGKWLVTLAAWLFAISTMITWSYYGEQGVVYMFRGKYILPYKLLFLTGILYGAAGIENTRHMITLMDLGTGAMLWANLPIVMALGYLAVRSLRDYDRRLANGEMHPHPPPSLTDVVTGKDVE